MLRSRLGAPDAGGINGSGAVALDPQLSGNGIGQCPVQSRLMPIVLSSLWKTLRNGILATTREKWFDGISFLVVVLYQAVFKTPSTFWEAASPFAWLVLAILAVHVVRATVRVWRDTSRRPTSRVVESRILLPDGSRRQLEVAEPHPSFFRLKLATTSFALLTTLALLAWVVRVNYMKSVRTYLYLVPARELVECERRAFFVRTVGPLSLHNVRISLRDNRSGQRQTNSYPEVDPHPQSMEPYIWVSPSSPWDEDYSVTVDTAESSSSQHLVLRSVAGQPRLGAEIAVGSEKRPIAQCRDAELPAEYAIAKGARSNCAEVMKLPDHLPVILDVASFQLADGDLTVRRVLRLPPPEELDRDSDSRHLTEYQEQLIRPVLRRYSGGQVQIYFAGGARTRRYAEEFYKLFHGTGWKSSIPASAPPGDQRIIDVQWSVNEAQNRDRRDPKLWALMSTLKEAGVKQRQRPVLDPAVPRDVFVLWIGPKSPGNIMPDRCAPAQLKPQVGQRHGCELISQTDMPCPFPPR